MASLKDQTELMHLTDGEWSKLIGEYIDALPKALENPPNVPDEPSSLSPYIDHTLLKLDATSAQIDDLCLEAVQYKFKSVCVRVNHVSRCKTNFSATYGEEHKPLIACVIGFHEGTYPTASKVSETHTAISNGAHELDLVLNHEKLRSGNYGAVYADILAVRQAAPRPTVLKVILEVSKLTRDEIVAGSVIASYAGADFVKTSTGFDGRGAEVEDVRIMSGVVGKGSLFETKTGRAVKVKASGGVRDRERALKMIRAGAERIGTSSGAVIVSGGKGPATTY